MVLTWECVGTKLPRIAQFVGIVGTGGSGIARGVMSVCMGCLFLVRAVGVCRALTLMLLEMEDMILLSFEQIEHRKLDDR